MYVGKGRDAEMEAFVVTLRWLTPSSSSELRDKCGFFFGGGRVLDGSSNLAYAKHSMTLSSIHPHLKRHIFKGNTEELF